MDEQFTRYGLTPEGGRVWESFAQPNWDAYLECYSRGPVGKNQVGVITSATLWRVQKILQNVRLLGHFPNPERTRLRVLRPWKATYWKTLPVGHRAIYLFPEIPHFDRVGVGWDDMPSGFMEVYENCRWYRWK